MFPDSASGSGQVVLWAEEQQQWLCFRDPVQIITTRQTGQVPPKLAQLETAVNERGLYAAGFLAYEAAPAFDPAMQVAPPSPLPLLWFGLYHEPLPLDLPSHGQHAPVQWDSWTSGVTLDEYRGNIGRIKQHIADGDSYQVNYTLRLHAPFSGDPWNLFRSLIQAQGTSYAAYLDLGRHAICSASPELFFRLSGRELVSRPMKGTAARGRTLAEDQAQCGWLQNSEKNRAENVMVVDMVRNDMGRIAQVGQVRVPHLFQVERYPTVWQMTSTVTARTDASFSRILAALFPCASITGAPKIRTMQIIAALEQEPRGVYTGCIGYLAPQRQAQFNVAIRTVTVDRETGRAEYGVGGGIVWDSDADDEYRECQIKARILTVADPPHFDLLESLLWTPESGYFLLEPHLERLADSAAYFGFDADREEIRRRLQVFTPEPSTVAHKVRLLVSPAGAITVQAAPLAQSPLPQPMRITLAAQPVDSNDPFLFHKTTHRRVYETARAARPDRDDVLLWNQRREITETTLANVVVELDGRLLTPPVEAGLLPGILRGWLLAHGEIEEETITVDDLRRASRICLINSVRKWMEAVLLEAGPDRIRHQSQPTPPIDML